MWTVCREETLRSLFIHSLLKGKGAEPILAGRALGKLEVGESIYRCLIIV